MASGELNCQGCGGTFKVDTLLWHTPAWCLIDVSPLVSTANVRGTDLVVPFADGTTALRRRPTATRVRLDLMFAGTFDKTGAPLAEPNEGLQANIAEFIATFVDPPGTTAGTRTAELTLDGGTVLSGPVHVERLEVALIPGDMARGLVFVSIPAGRLA